MPHQASPSLNQGDYVTLDRVEVHTFSPGDVKHTDCGIPLDHATWYHPMTTWVDLPQVCVQCANFHAELRAALQHVIR
jgi:hypothetical protein